MSLIQEIGWYFNIRYGNLLDKSMTLKNWDKYDKRRIFKILRK